MQNGITVAGGNRVGNVFSQLHGPYNVHVDDDDTLYIADCWNHRIMEWKSGAIRSQLVAGGKRKGNQSNMLQYPLNVIIDKESDFLTISDYGNRRVVR